jgi:hypothetical protein
VASRCRFATGFVPLLVLTALVLLPLARAHAASCHYYVVTLQGIVTTGDANFTSAAREFVVSQYAMWRDAGVVSHPVEFRLTTFQDLNAAAQEGQIELMTNSYFAHNAGIASARFDLATVTIGHGVVNFELDLGMSFQLPPPNVFIAPGIGDTTGGLGGLCFLPGGGGDLCQIGRAPVVGVSYFIPRAGGGYFFTYSNGSNIAGELYLVGSGPDNLSFQGQYQAQFNGTYVNSFPCD